MKKTSEDLTKSVFLTTCFVVLALGLFFCASSCREKSTHSMAIISAGTTGNQQVFSKTTPDEEAPRNPATPIVKVN